MRRVVASNGVVFYKSDIIPCSHGFSTRIGGKSILPHTASLNLGMNRDDEASVVLDNLSLMSDAVGISAQTVISARQIHSSYVRYVSNENCGEGFYSSTMEPCDGYVTDVKNVALGIKTADCVPILFYSPQNQNSSEMIAAVHAGWRGTCENIIFSAIEQMLLRGASVENIRVAIGPCISKCCYEVSKDFYEAFSNVLGENAASRFITLSKQKENSFYADLSGINQYLLIKSGIKEENIDIAHICTFCNPEEFYSHRYSREKRGTMLSVISL